MNILWASNYSSQSGYSIQARLFVPRIKALGHHVTVFELSNGSRMPQEIDGVKIVPTGLDPLGSDMMQAHMQGSRAHCVITLIDAWGMNKGVMEQVQWFPITPVDTQPAAPHVVEALAGCQRPIAMSRYGEGELRKVGLDPLYWPHAVDPTIWRPQDKAEARRKLGVPEHVFFPVFVGVNDSIPSRKGIPELLMAWQVFSDLHPDSILYLHTSESGNLAINNNGGVRIDKLIKTFGINRQTVRMVDQYRYRTGIPAAELATIAAAADVLVLPTRGEGFGLPVLEFARVGTPAIVTDFAASPELCFAGWRISYEPEWNWQNAVVAKPGISSLIEALEAANADRDNPARKQRSIEGAREYDVDNVVSRYTIPALREIGEYVLDAVRVS